MKKLLTIIGAILIVFILFSFWLYRRDLTRTEFSLGAVNLADAAQETLETADGWIGSVDAEAKIMTLLVGNQTLTFLLDEGAAVTESGEMIQPAAIAVGKRATVKYVQRSGHKKARSIAIYPATTPQTF